jgi:IS30 family transposase
MGQKQCNREGWHGKYLTESDRHKLEAFLKVGTPIRVIAEELEKHPRTIRREIKRGQVTVVDSLWREKKVYSADYAQSKHRYNVSNKGPTLKIGKDHNLAGYIEKKIKEEKFSPDAVIGEIKKKNLEFNTVICTKTVYNYIDKGIFLDMSNKDLPEKSKRKRGRNKHKKQRISNPRGRSIEQRPKEADAREEYGHWEMDSVVGGKNKGSEALLVLTERKSREEIIRKMADKTQESVVAAIDKLEIEYKENFPLKFKTFTVDNGVEFLNHKGIESSLLSFSKRTNVYYAHAYSSWERGSNENANKLIRRFIPKGADIGLYTETMIKRLQNWINNYPRKIFNYRSSNDILKEIGAIV